MATLEHVNVTVSDPDRTAAMLDAIFGWKIRWQGESDLGGRTMHVGQPGVGETYLALYSHDPRPSLGSVQQRCPITELALHRTGIS